jgi:amino acid adenylation domain-containing protein
VLINVLEYLEQTSERIPENTAVLDETGSFSFAELRHRARVLAMRITSSTASRNLPIAVYLPKSKECVVAFAAILYSGNCYSPLDTKSPIQRVLSVLAKLRPQLVITDRPRAEQLASAGIAADLLLCIDAETASNGSGEITFPSNISTDPAYIIHTSGSTGVPKGVVVSHGSIIDYIEWARDCYSITDQDRTGNQAPFYFDNSVLDIYLSFSTGAALIIIPEEYFSFPMKLMEYVRDERITFIFWVPSLMASIANMNILSHVHAPTLQKILFAGEVMQNRHLNYWRRSFPDALFSNLYGPTEITVDCTYYIVDREFSDDEPLPIGFPRRNSDILILDADDRVVSVGEPGEICVRGTALAHGYWNEPEVTAAAFTQNPLNTHYSERIYRTGDLAYRNERGEIYFLGRSDQQIKHMGYRIELGEIETAAFAISEIRNVCVIHDAANSQLVMFYQADQPIDPPTIRKAMLLKIPKYMVPAVCVYVKELPLNPNGKIDRKALTARLQDRP